MSNPDYGAVLNEAGPATADAVQGLFLLENANLVDLMRSIGIAKDLLEPKVLVSAPSANTNNLALSGSSVIHFNGATSVNLTGLVAPAPGKARIVLIHVSGAGTITLKHQTTSTATNQLSLITGADTALATGNSAIFIYLSSLWRQVL